jgi:hypothetical protein
MTGSCGKFLPIRVKASPLEKRRMHPNVDELERRPRNKGIALTRSLVIKIPP